MKLKVDQKNLGGLCGVYHDETGRAIAKEMKDLNAFDIKEATKIICGSARSMGIEVKE